MKIINNQKQNNEENTVSPTSIIVSNVVVKLENNISPPIFNYLFIDEMNTSITVSPTYIHCLFIVITKFYLSIFFLS